MQWWDRAATILTTPGTILRRFGFVTTNSITQQFSRRVIARHMTGECPLSLVMACPDHPWTKATREAAAVRIAMTVAESGRKSGCLIEVVSEAELESDLPRIEIAATYDLIRPNLGVGPDVALITPLAANAGLASNGMKPLGSGFIISQSDLEELEIDQRDDWQRVVRPYINGRDLAARPRGVFAIDFFGLSEAQARSKYPEAYQHLLQTVLPERQATALRSKTKDANEDAATWWLFCRPRPELRAFSATLERVIVSVQTARHRVFQFLSTDIMPDQKLMVFGLRDGYSLGLLSSRTHRVWSEVTGGWLGVGNDSVYAKGKTFDPFPFPDPTPTQRSAIADFAEELDATRKAALAEHPRLTMTGLYNLVEKLRAGASLTPAEERNARDARARIVRHLHDQLDAAVAAAYGWPVDLAPAEIVACLVALNAERAAEEAAGHVRWLRPDYQIPRFAK